MILFWHKTKMGEKSRALLERALLAYCEAIGKKRPRKKSRAVSEMEHGKPYFPVLTSVFFSVSHSGPYWAVAFDNRPCGVDIEWVTKKRARSAIVQRKFAEAERVLFEQSAPAEEQEKRVSPISDSTPTRREKGASPISDSSAPEQEKAISPINDTSATKQEKAISPISDALIAPKSEAVFLAIWTRKEAYLKYTGEGLTRDTRTFSVATIGEDGRAAFTEEAAPYYGESRIALREIDFSTVFETDGTPLPLIGAVCGGESELRILPLPEKEPEEEWEATKEIALSFVETRERTEWEVREKLKTRDVPPEYAEQAIAFLREYGFLNDASYAKRYTELSIEKGRGPLRILRDLRRKGIRKEDAEEALSPYRNGGAFAEKDASANEGETFNAGRFEEPIQSFRERASSSAQTFYEALGRPELDEKVSAKILRRLASRGFTASDSYAALSDLRRTLRERE